MWDPHAWTFEGPACCARDGPLLTDTCFVGEPQFNRFARCFSGQRGGYEIGKPALKTTCSSGSLCGCCGRTERRRNDSLRNSLPIVRSCNSTANSCSIRCCRSTHASGPHRLDRNQDLAPPIPPPCRRPQISLCQVQARDRHSHRRSPSLSQERRITPHRVFPIHLRVSGPGDWIVQLRVERDEELVCPSFNIVGVGDTFRYHAVEKVALRRDAPLRERRSCSFGHGGTRKLIALTPEEGAGHGKRSTIPFRWREIRARDDGFHQILLQHDVPGMAGHGGVLRRTARTSRH